MITVQAARSYRNLIIGVVATLVLALGVYVTISTMRSASAADPTIIYVTTTTDEDATPGTGCSIYEAVVSASTDAGYGGCAPGSSENGTIISVPAGTYVNNATENTPRRTIELNNISFEGAGVDQTFLQAYFVELKGDADAHFSGVNLSNVNGDLDRNPGVSLSVNGSNKTVTDVVITSSMPGSAPNYVRLAGDGSTVENITLDHVSLLNGSDGSITCGGTCADITIVDYVGSAQYRSSINLENSENVSIDYSRITSPNGGDVEVGENSSISNLVTVVTDSGSSYVKVKAGTVINGIDQNIFTPFGTLRVSGEAASVKNIVQTAAPYMFNGDRAVLELLVDTPVIEGYVVDGGSVYLRNDYEGSDIRGLSIYSDQDVVVLNSKSSVLKDINILSASNSYIALTNTRDNATIEDITLSALDSGAYSPINAAFNGNNNTFERIVASSALANSRIDFSGTNPTLDTMDFDNVIPVITMSGPDVAPFSVNRVTVDGGSDFGLMITGNAFTTGSITNSIIRNTDRGIYVTGTGGETLNVRNTQVSDVGSMGAPGALFASNVTHVNLDTVTIARSRAVTPGIIYLQGGESHSIKNTTIFDSNGGIMATSTDRPLATDVNNVTILNNHNSPEYTDNTESTGLMGYGSEDAQTIFTVSNSIIGGVSDYITCKAFDFTVFTVDHSLASDQSCVDAGFTQVQDIETLVVPAVSSNDSINEGIGYLGEEFTETVRLADASQALKFGDTTTCEAKDARGIMRDLAAGCDAGSYQLTVAGEEEEQVPGGSGNDGGSGAGSNTGSQGSGVPSKDSNDIKKTLGGGATVSVESGSGDDVENEPSSPTLISENNTAAPSDVESEDETTEEVAGVAPGVVVGVIGGVALLGGLIFAAVAAKRRTS